MSVGNAHKLFLCILQNKGSQFAMELFFSALNISEKLIEFLKLSCILWKVNGNWKKKCTIYDETFFLYGIREWDRYRLLEIVIQCFIKLWCPIAWWGQWSKASCCRQKVISSKKIKSCILNFNQVILDPQQVLTKAPLSHSSLNLRHLKSHW